MLEPIRAVQPVQSDEKKGSREKLRTVSPPYRRRAQQQEAGGQTNGAFQNSGSPMQGGKSLGAVSLHVINRCQNQSAQREGQVNPAVPANHAVHHCHQEEQQSRGLARQISQIQSRQGTRKKQHLADARKRQAEPSCEPKTKITPLVIAAKKGEQHQQYDECAGFEEGNRERALIFQHDGSASRPDVPSQWRLCYREI